MAKPVEKISIADFYMTGMTLAMASAVMPPTVFAELVATMEMATIFDALDSPAFREEFAKEVSIARSMMEV